VDGDGFRLEHPRANRRGRHPDNDAPQQQRARRPQLSPPKPTAQSPHVRYDPPRPRPGRQPGREPQLRPASAEPGHRPRRDAGLATKLDQRDLLSHPEGQFAQLSDQILRDRHDWIPAPGVPDPKPRRSTAETFESLTLQGNVARIFRASREREFLGAPDDTPDTAVAHQPARRYSVFVQQGCISRAGASQDDQFTRPGHPACYNSGTGVDDMNRMVVKSTVGSDGVLHLDLPMGPDEANAEVQVTVEPVANQPMTPKEWRAWVQSLAGSVTDPTFERPPQGEYEAREPLP